MSSKKAENRKSKKLSLFRYKIVLKSWKNWKWNPCLELKVSFVFSMIYISLKTNKEFKKIDNQTITNTYIKFFKSEWTSHKDFLVSLLSDSTKKFDFGFRIEYLDSDKLYDSLFSFFSNSNILDYSSRKKKLKKIIIEEDGLQNFMNLNQNLKLILNFIKKSSPTKFNWIFRKIMTLT